jgi:hypothetical protein
MEPCSLYHPDEDSAPFSRLSIWPCRKVIGLSTPLRTADITNDHVGKCLSFTQLLRIFDIVPKTRTMKDAWLARPKIPRAMKRRWLAYVIVQCFGEATENPVYFCLCKDAFQPRHIDRRCWICHRYQELDSWHYGQYGKCVADFRLRCVRYGGKSEDFNYQTRRACILRDAHALSMDLVMNRAISHDTDTLLLKDFEGLIQRRWLEDESFFALKEKRRVLHDSVWNSTTRIMNRNSCLSVRRRNCKRVMRLAP